MTKPKLSFVLASTALILTAGCSHASKHADQPAPTPQQQAVAQIGADREAYVAQTQTRINEMQKFGDTLRAQATTAQKPRQKKLENAADDMDSSLKDVSKALTNVKQAAPENWLDEKRDVTKAMMRAETQYSDSVHLIQ